MPFPPEDDRISRMVDQGVGNYYEARLRMGEDTEYPTQQRDRTHLASGGLRRVYRGGGRGRTQLRDSEVDPSLFPPAQRLESEEDRQELTERIQAFRERLQLEELADAFFEGGERAMRLVRQKQLKRGSERRSR